MTPALYHALQQASAALAEMRGELIRAGLGSCTALERARQAETLLLAQLPTQPADLTHS